MQLPIYHNLDWSYKHRNVSRVGAKLQTKVHTKVCYHGEGMVESPYSVRHYAKQTLTPW